MLLAESVNPAVVSRVRSTQTPTAIPQLSLVERMPSDLLSASIAASRTKKMPTKEATRAGLLEKPARK